MQKTINDYASYIRNTFGERIQKISVNAGFTCPNRDGSKGIGGCTYCNNQTFNPAYTLTPSSIEAQISKGKNFFAKKNYTKFLAYFQAYTNTYGEVDDIIKKYEIALRQEGIVGIIVGTRPDCMPDPLLDYFAEKRKSTYISIEYGVESTLNKTLDRINRCHTYEESIEAIEKTASRGIPVGAHLIIGLPGESRADILSHATSLSKLPLTALKLHQLQIIKGTTMFKEYLRAPDDFKLFEVTSYIETVIDFLEHLNPEFAMERFISQSPADYLIAPKWGLKNFEFVDKLKKRIAERETYQGRLYKG